MYKIGIIGHSPEYLHSSEETGRVIEQTIDLLCFQYDVEQMVYNIIGDIGVGLMAAKVCYDRKVPCHIILPYQLEDTVEHWYKEQQDELRLYLQWTKGITICNTSVEAEDISHENLVDNSNFVVCFWNGKLQGKTFKAIEYALSSNKLILNGLNDLKLITSRDTKKKRKIYQ